jgi:cardiolipin synthase
MNLATKTTLFRLIMAPVFVVLAVRYGASVDAGSPDGLARWAAVIVFTLAAVSDALDGYIARHFDQESRLGGYLDPIADKALMWSALITLTFSNWGQTLPLWYAAFILARDVIQLSGALVIGFIAGDIKVVPHWSGKLATALQIAAIGWVLLGVFTPPVAAIAGAAAFFTFISTVLYIHSGLCQLPDHHYGRPHHS